MATPRQVLLLVKLSVIAGAVIVGAVMNPKSFSVSPAAQNSAIQKVEGYEGRYRISENNEALAKARKEAAKTLPGFLERFNSGKEKDSEFAVLVRFHSGRAVDYMWVTKLEKLTETRYRGILDGSSLRVPELAQGKPVGFDKKNIVDWAISSEKSIEGAYTERAIQKLASKS